MKKQRYCAAFFLICGLSLSCSKGTATNQGTQSVSASAKPIALRIGNTTAQDHILNITFEEMAKAINERSGGRIEATVYPNGQLGTLRTMTEGLQLGTLEMATQSPGGLASFWPTIGVLELPYMFQTNQEVYDVLDGDVGQELNKKFLEKTQIRILAYWMNLVRQTTNSKRPIKTADDFKGLKLRVPETKAIVEAFRGLGASPTPMPFGDLYTGLAQGTVDGQENPSSIIYASKLYEVQKYLSLTNHVFSPVVVMISEDFYKKLPEDLRNIINEEVLAARSRCRPISERMDDELTEELKKYLEVNTVNTTGFRELAQPAYDDIVKTAGQEAKDYIARIESGLRR
ncbi:MAG: TRAP transporter substrate-binding protein [Spirochaetaceae bacterium]|jgi:tripartite ATP-independent transporter DctP family solute receptor|nr:TRAP transporter substrate-binding protein [Spirochaetaceae bacterium]